MNINRLGRAVRLAVVAVGVACGGGGEGPTGPAGPAGPQGAQGLPGPAGPGTHVVLTSTVGSTGGATVALPAAAGNSFSNPPVMSCYLTSVGSSVWLAVAGTPGGSTSPYCGLVLSNGIFNAVMTQAPPGWTAAFVVVY